MNSPPDHIHLQGIECQGHIGVTESERAEAQRLLVDIWLGLDLQAAGYSDLLDLTLDYSEIVKLVREEVSKSRFKLLETLAHRLIQPLLALPRVEEVRLEIHKFPADLEGQLRQASVCINRKNPGSES